ncbi:MAG: transcription antitermination factor NusB [Deltaproteobacteria bacterium]|jgi:N utilization substance protein B|nr:transcription antitermination factor NusB [Deltaproteobacteria bacterium]
MPKKTGTSRRGERELAFQFLYALDFSPAHTERELRERFEQSASAADKAPALPGYAWDLALGVWNNAQAVDALIARFAHNWRLDRMGRIELTLLRLAMYELRFRPDIPPRVVINEALELCRQFGEANARSFINGILDAAAKAPDQDSKTAGTDPDAQQAAHED